MREQEPKNQQQRTITGRRDGLDIEKFRAGAPAAAAVPNAREKFFTGY
jgi:hypothetical protein